MKQRLLIIGAGEFGLQVLHYALIDGRYDVVGFVDDWQKKGSLIKELPILGTTNDIMALYQSGLFDALFIAIGYKHLATKKTIFEKYDGQIPFASIIANPTYIDHTATIGNGVIVYPGCVIDKNVVIGDNVVLNLNVVISHDTSIGHSTFCAPRVSIAGFSKIASCCFLGIGSCVIDNISINDRITVGASGLVITDLIQEGTYIGVPVSLIKSN